MAGGDVSRADAGRARHDRQLWLALAGYLAAWAAMTYPQVLSFYLVHEPDDPAVKIWQLAWVAHALRTDPWRLFDGNIFFPARWTIAYSDTILVPSLLAAPMLWLGVPAAAVYNLFLMCGFVLSGLSAFVLVRSLTSRWEAAWVAGLAFAFLPYRFAHYLHLELQLTVWLPLALWGLHRLFDKGRPNQGLLTGALIGLQALTCLYYGLFFAIYLVPVCVVLLVSSRRRWGAVRGLAMGAVVAAALVAPIALVHSRASDTVGVRPIGDVERYSAVPEDYLRANDTNYLYGRRSDREITVERRVFPGFVLIGLAVAGLLPLRSAVRVAYLAGGLAAFDASLGFGGIVYRFLWDHLSLFHGIRAPARFGVFVGLSLVVLAGFGVARLAAWLPRRAVRIPVIAALSLLVLAESWSVPLPLVRLPSGPTAVYSWLANQPAAAVVELPVDRTTDPLYVYSSIFHWQPLLNGKSGFTPPWYGGMRTLSETFPSPDSLADLRRRHVTWVIVHRTLMAPHTYEDIIASAVRQPGVTLVGHFPADEPESAVYRIR